MKLQIIEKPLSMNKCAAHRDRKTQKRPNRCAVSERIIHWIQISSILLLIVHWIQKKYRRVHEGTEEDMNYKMKKQCKRRLCRRSKDERDFHVIFNRPFYNKSDALLEDKFSFEQEQDHIVSLSVHGGKDDMQNEPLSITSSLPTQQRLFLLGDSSSSLFGDRNELSQDVPIRHMARVVRQEDGAQYQVWDFTNNPTLNSLSPMLYTSHAIYVLIWHIGYNDPAALPHTNGILLNEEEKRSKSANQLLIRDIDTIIYHLRRIPEGAAILPIAVPIGSLSESEAKECYQIFKQRLSCKKRDDIQEPLLWENEVDVANCDKTLSLLQFIKKVVPQHLQTSMQFSPPPLAFRIVHIMASLREEHKFIHKEKLLYLLQDHLEADVRVENMDSALHFLSSFSEEEVLYFGSRVTAGGGKFLFDNNSSQFIFLDMQWFLTSMASFINATLYDLREVRYRRKVHFDIGYTLVDPPNSPVVCRQDVHQLLLSKEIVRREMSKHSFSKYNILDLFSRLLVQNEILIPIHPSDGSHEEIDDSSLFLLPSVLGEISHWSDAWTYKCSESWKVTLCHSWTFMDNMNLDVSHLMKRVMTSILSSVHAVTSKDMCSNNGEDLSNPRGRTLWPGNSDTKFYLHDVLCWKNAILIVLGSVNKSSNKENLVEIFVHLAPPTLCVASESTPQGALKLSLSGKGQIGCFGEKVYKGGYDLVMSSIDLALKELDSLKEVVCPDCMAHHAVSKAYPWKYNYVVEKNRNNRSCSVICCRGHAVDTTLLTGGRVGNNSAATYDFTGSIHNEAANCCRNSLCCTTIAPVTQLLRGVVLVGLWDGKTKKIKRIGSGFVVDRKLGLIVSASHTLINMGNSEDSDCPFGADYDDCKYSKAVIGIIPPQLEKGSSGKTKRKRPSSTATEAVFRYFAEIVAKDVNNVDACVLRITTKMEKDVRGQGEYCGDVAEIPLVNDQVALKKEKLTELKVTRHFELQEHVRILGYNQGGEGLVSKPGMYINRHFDFACGYICKHFKTDWDDEVGNTSAHRSAILDRGRNVFHPREEIVVICPTIAGHSGGPCVNSSGEVVGILSRVDSSESQRCYVTPASEWKHLVKKAKIACTTSNLIDMLSL